MTGSETGSTSDRIARAVEHAYVLKPVLGDANRGLPLTAKLWCRNSHRPRRVER